MIFGIFKSFAVTKEMASHIGIDVKIYQTALTEGMVNYAEVNSHKNNALSEGMSQNETMDFIIGLYAEQTEQGFQVLRNKWGDSMGLRDNLNLKEAHEAFQNYCSTHEDIRDMIKASQPHSK